MAKNKEKRHTPICLIKLHIDQIEFFYETSSALSDEFGILFEVEHIIPLRGITASGLHVPWNLRIVTKKQNRKKNNKHVSI